MPRVPPVTKVVMPWSDHLLSLKQLNFVSAIFATYWNPSNTNKVRASDYVSKQKYKM